MAARMRLTRTGAKGKPSYRIIVADSRSPRDGRFIEILGYYDPRTQPATIEVDREKALDWLRKGALPSESVRSLLIRAGVIEEGAPAKTGEADTV